MRAIGFLFLLLLFCGIGLMVAAMLSPDAVAMAVGLLFGVLAGIPTAALMMADRRRDDGYREEHHDTYGITPAASYTYNTFNTYNDNRVYHDNRSTTNNTTNNRLELRDRGEGLPLLPPAKRDARPVRLIGGGK